VCLSDPDSLTMSQTVSDFDRRPMTISDSNNGRGVVASEAASGGVCSKYRDQHRNDAVASIPRIPPSPPLQLHRQLSKAVGTEYCTSDNGVSISPD